MAVTVITEGVRYIKIAKIDKDGVDQTNTYENLTKLTIPFSSGPIVYDILSITEFPTYFLYYVVNPNLEWNDRADLEYDFTGSYTGLYPTFNFSPPITSSIDNQNFFLEGGPVNNGLGNTSSPIDSYRVLTKTQKNLEVNVSSSLQFKMEDAKGTTTSVSASIRILSSPLTVGSVPSNPTIHSQQLISQSVQAISPANPFIFTGSYHISASILPSLIPPGDCIYFEIRGAVDGGDYGSNPSIEDIQFDNGTFSISSTTALGPEMQTIPEPYFSRDFSRALDCQPTLNNVFNNRRSTKYQDVDYSEGLLTPNNYDLIISGSALKAEVQDSNYTLLRHTRPRYEGSKSTSRFINKWTKNDIGTYGTSPTVESLKTILAYSTAISSSEPEIMNSSEIFVKYLIKADGDVIIPNTTPNSVDDNKDTFLSGELIEINTQDKPGSGGSQFRSIIRGGKRIEPVSV
jgi:hypothetical protein